VLRHPAFVDGSAVSTAFIGRHFPDAASRASVPDAATWALAAWLSVAAAPEVRNTPPEWRDWSTGLPMPRPWRLHWLAPASCSQSIDTDAAGHVLLEPGRAVIARPDSRAILDGRAVAERVTGQVEIDGAGVAYRYAWDESTLWVQTPAGDFAFECRRRQAARGIGANDAASPEVRAGINGRVLEVCVTEGATVSKGDRLVVLEAMKMEHEVRATRSGRVAAVGVKAGDQVSPGQWLVRLEGEA